MQIEAAFGVHKETQQLLDWRARVFLESPEPLLFCEYVAATLTLHLCLLLLLLFAPFPPAEGSTHARCKQLLLLMGSPALLVPDCTGWQLLSVGCQCQQRRLCQQQGRGSDAGS
jgi:hypothetical protein